MQCDILKYTCNLYSWYISNLEFLNCMDETLEAVVRELDLIEGAGAARYATGEFIIIHC